MSTIAIKKIIFTHYVRMFGSTVNNSVLIGASWKFIKNSETNLIANGTLIVAFQTLY